MSATTPGRVPELGAVAYEAAENVPLRDELAKAEETIADYRDALCAMQAERDSLTGRVAELVTEGNQLRGQNADLIAERSQLHDAIRRIRLIANRPWSGDVAKGASDHA